MERVNLLGSGPRLTKKEFTGPRSHAGLEYLKPPVQSSSHIVTSIYEWLHSLHHAWSTTHKRLHARMMCVCVCVCVCEKERERK